MSYELREMNLRAQQSGAALMAMLAVFVLGASWWLLSALNTPTSRVALEREHNARVLAEAKQALLGWAARNAIDNEDNNPGRLPCPEPAGAVGNPATEGIMQNICGAGTVIGRLPWRSLGLPKLLDAKGEPLWYVLSSGWKLNAGGANEWLGINSNSVGQLALDGTGNGAVAMLIAPGAELALAPNANQSAAGCIARVQRRGTTPQNHLDYVECHSVAGASVRTAVVDNATNHVSNDQTVVLTAPEILAAVEPAVAVRITRDVIPALQGMFGATYNTSQWGRSATTPLLPFAAPFADTSASAFQGAPGQTQGLLPLSRSQCNPLTDPLCDPNFVHWAINDPDQATYPNPSAVQTVFNTRTADLAGTPDCVSSSTSQVVTCTISYSGQCGGGLNLAFLLGGRCYLEFQVSVRARAKNIGSAARAFDATPIAVSESPWSLASSATPINSVGSAAADIRVELPPASCACFPVLCLLIGCNAANTVTVTVPIAIFPDHPSLTELFASPRNWAWFVKNNWHHVVYYSISPSHAASAAVPHNCSDPLNLNCITVAGGSLPPSSRAIIAFAGRSLSNAARPNANLNDYLDTAINRDGNTAFEQIRFDKNFNDRFFAISNY